VNEALCRALMSSGLGEEDVAARLEVDTKTVRRWLEGRVPYRRHRWALSAILQVSDVDLWPQLRADQVRPDEVLAVYPHRDQVSHGIWLRVLGSATQDIDVLARSGTFLAAVPGAFEVLSARIRAGVRARICLRDPAWSPAANDSRGGETNAEDGGAAKALNLFSPLRADGDVQVRLHRVDHYGTLIFADDQLLAIPRVYGIPSGQCPVLHLRRTGETAMFESYRDSFERIWSSSDPYVLRPLAR
jgi:hypothetical protein